MYSTEGALIYPLILIDAKKHINLLFGCSFGLCFSIAGTPTDIKFTGIMNQFSLS